MRSRVRTKQLVQLGCVLIFVIVAALSLALPRAGAASLASLTPENLAPDTASPAPEAAGGKMPSPVIVFDDPDKKSSPFAGDKGQAPFDHEQHIAKEKCATCHHTNSTKLTRALEEAVRKCSECHKADDSTCELEGTAEGKTFKGKSAVSSKDAYHGNGSELGCVGCHQTRDKNPKGCNDCHTSESTIKYQYKK